MKLRLLLDKEIMQKDGLFQSPDRRFPSAPRFYRYHEQAEFEGEECGDNDGGALSSYKAFIH